MKKLCFLTLLLLTFPLFVHAQNPGDYYFANYDIINLDFLRTRYFEIDNGRSIQFEGYFKSKTWLEPFAYKERLHLISFDVDRYNLVQFSLKENDGYHYAFPILMFHSLTGDLKELDQLAEGDHIVVYGRFYNLKKADFAIEVDAIDKFKANRVNVKGETYGVDTGGHDRTMLLDGRVSPTPTPSATPTDTPGPTLWQKVNNMVNPKETATVTGTVTPDVNVNQ